MTEPKTYEQATIERLEKERDQLAAKCAALTDLSHSAYSLIIEHHSSSQMREELIVCPCCTTKRGDGILNRLHAAYTNPDRCGEGWCSPEKKKVLVEALQNTLELLLIMFDIDGRPIEPHEKEVINQAKQALEACK